MLEIVFDPVVVVALATRQKPHRRRVGGISDDRDKTRLATHHRIK